MTLDFYATDNDVHKLQKIRCNFMQSRPPQALFHE